MGTRVFAELRGVSKIFREFSMFFALFQNCNVYVQKEIKLLQYIENYCKFVIFSATKAIVKQNY